MCTGSICQIGSGLCRCKLRRAPDIPINPYWATLPCLRALMVSERQISCEPDIAVCFKASR